MLAGPPTRVKARLIASQFAIVEWNTPKLLPETVTSYNVHLRKMDTDETFTVMEKDHAPIIIEDLDANSFYEVYVVAQNVHGRGPPSSRLVFKTKPQVSRQFNDRSLYQSHFHATLNDLVSRFNVTFFFLD